MPNALQTAQVGNGPAGQTSTQNTIPAASTVLPLTQPSSSVCLNNGSNATTIYYVLGSGTASATTSAFINPLQSFNYSGPPITAITIIGSAASGSYSLSAW